MLEDSSVVLEPPEARLETRTQAKGLGLVQMAASWTLRDGREEQGRARAGDALLIVRRFGRDQLVYTWVYMMVATSEDARVSAGMTASVCRMVNDGRPKACAGSCAKERAASVLGKARNSAQAREHRMFDLLLSVWS